MAKDNIKIFGFRSDGILPVVNESCLCLHLWWPNINTEESHLACHINIPDKTKGQESFDLQFFPLQGKDEEKCKLISSSTTPAAGQMIKTKK